MKKLTLLSLLACAYSTHAAIIPPSGGGGASKSLSYASNWFGGFPSTTLATSLTNGVRYVSATAGNNSGNGLTVATAYSNIWYAVHNSTSTIIRVGAGSFTDSITNYNNHMFYFDSGSTNSVTGKNMFVCTNNLYVGGLGTFQAKGAANVVAWVGGIAASQCQFYGLSATAGNDVFDTMYNGMISDIGVRTLRATNGWIFDHSAQSTINVYSSYLDSVNDLSLGAQTIINLYNCAFYQESSADLQGYYNVYGGTWSATNGFIYNGATETVGGAVFYGTIIDSVLSIPTNYTSGAVAFTVSGYVKYPNGNNYFSAANRGTATAEAPYTLPNVLDAGAAGGPWAVSPATGSQNAGGFNLSNLGTLTAGILYSTGASNNLAGDLGIGGTLYIGGAGAVSTNLNVQGTIFANNAVFTNGEVTLQTFYPTNSGAGLAADFSKGNTWLTTNASFTFLAPINVRATNDETTVTTITNSSGSTIQITCPTAGLTGAQIITNGVWNCTNGGVTKITWHHDGSYLSNAVASPIR